MKTQPPKALLLQFRHDKEILEEEQSTFIRASGIEGLQLKGFNVMDQPHFGPEILSGVDVLLIGGSSDVSCIDSMQPFVSSCRALIEHCVAESLPVFSSCFGFQLGVVSFGGQIVRDESDYEMGTALIHLNSAASQDPVCGNLPDSFYAISVHQEKAIELPRNCLSLGYNAHCIQAYRVIDKPFWAFQFHPEVDEEILIKRLGKYKDCYTRGDSHYQEIISSLKPTPHAARLLKNFFQYVSLTKDQSD